MRALNICASNPTWAVQDYVGYNNENSVAKDQFMDNIFSLALAKSLQKVDLQVEFVSNPHDVPSTGKSIREAYELCVNDGKPMPIYTGGQYQLYWSKRTNLMYRVLHDYDHAVHYPLGLGTTKLKDEKYLNGLMMWRVLCLPVSDDYKFVDLLDCAHALYYDLISTQQYYAAHGEFVLKQYDFVQERMQNYLNKCVSVDSKLASIKRMLTECGLDFNYVGTL